MEMEHQTHKNSWLRRLSTILATAASRLHAGFDGLVQMDAQCIVTSTVTNDISHHSLLHIVCVCRVAFGIIAQSAGQSLPRRNLPLESVVAMRHAPTRMNPETSRQRLCLKMRRMGDGKRNVRAVMMKSRAVMKGRAVIHRLKQWNRIKPTWILVVKATTGGANQASPKQRLQQTMILSWTSMPRARRGPTPLTTSSRMWQVMSSRVPMRKRAWTRKQTATTPRQRPNGMAMKWLLPLPMRWRMTRRTTAKAMTEVPTRRRKKNWKSGKARCTPEQCHHFFF
mmetsp:Transcript_1557/g.4236  ORF Transcript_1557/g.4236 Transcript_1557/m.4236 type:complete len:282 (-) Transcript_1557:189-1034(-)